MIILRLGLLSALLLNITAQADILIGYDFDSGASDRSAPTLVATDITATPLTSPMAISFVETIGDNTGLDSLGTSFGKTTQLGAVGISVNAATTASFEAALSANHYLSFIVTPTSGETLHLSNITFKAIKKATTSVDEYGLAGSNGNIIAARSASSVGALTGAYENLSISLVGTDHEYLTRATEFRIYAWGRGTTETANTLAAVDKITVHGTVLPQSSIEYFVATDGSDTNPGSLGAPFATIQHAVDQLLPGDMLSIRGGTYRETVDLGGVSGATGFPITIQAHNDEAVLLDGSDPLTSTWTLESGNVFTTTLTENITQLFVDGKAMTLARYPNALAFSDDAFRENNRLSQAASSPNGTITGSADLAATGIDFTDCVAIVNFKAHVTWARLVQGHSAGSDTFTYSSIEGPIKTHQYFFEGGLGNAARVMLDSQEEWSFDETTKTLSFWPDNGQNPGGRVVSGKTRPYAFTGNGTTHDLIIDGLDFFATSFFFDSSDQITIQNCNFDYPAASRRALGDIAAPLSPQFKGTEIDRCENITVFNCAFQNSDGTALRVEHSIDTLVENNLFYRTEYAPVGVAGTVNLRQSPGTIYRRNTIDISGDAMGVLLSSSSGNITEPWVLEYNFHTSCGLIETDGSSVYAAHEAVVESVGRFNWFIGNDARDYRWDGNNTPTLLGRDANFYRNVLMADRIKGIATEGDGARLKGDFHEVYNNVGIYTWSDIDVSEDKGGNDNSFARNNAATKLTGDINDPARASSNIINGAMGRLLRDPDNWDFRPRESESELIDQGTETTASINGETINITADFNGTAPDIGVYESGKTSYWIPGRQETQAAMPVPRIDGEYVQLDTDLMYLIGLHGVSANIYFGTDPNSLSFLTSKIGPENIVTLSDFITLEGNTTYHWRVDTVLADSSIVSGKVWSFTTKLTREIMPWKKRTVSGGASWVQDSPNGSLVYDNNAESFDRRAIAYSTDTFQSDGGFKLTVGYLTGSIDDTAGHNFSFGLISTETDLSTYGGFNPFRADTSVYSIGTNLTTDIDPSARGLNFTNGSTRTTLDESGTNVQFGTNLRFQTNESNVVVIEITPGGNWTYSINGITEASGVIAEGFDLSKSYRVAVYGQDDHGDGKVIQHLSLECKVTPEENFATWAAAHGLAGVDALIDSDTSDHDGYSNLMEFALGMNPTVADPRSRDYYTSVIEGENHFFVYEYYRRSDCVAQGLSYELEVSPDLQNPVTNPPFDADVGDSINGFEKVTSRFLIDDPKKFIRLKVKSLPQ